MSSRPKLRLEFVDSSSPLVSVTEVCGGTVAEFSVNFKVHAARGDDVEMKATAEMIAVDESFGR